MNLFSIHPTEVYLKILDSEPKSTRLEKPSQPPEHFQMPARKVDPIVVQPLPATDLDCFRAAGVKRVLFGFLPVMRTKVHGLYCRAEQRVKSEPSKPLTVTRMKSDPSIFE